MEKIPRFLSSQIHFKSETFIFNFFQEKWYCDQSDMLAMGYGIGPDYFIFIPSYFQG